MHACDATRKQVPSFRQAPPASEPIALSGQTLTVEQYIEEQLLDVGDDEFLLGRRLRGLIESASLVVVVAHSLTGPLATGICQCARDEADVDPPLASGDHVLAHELGARR